MIVIRLLTFLFYGYMLVMLATSVLRFLRQRPQSNPKHHETEMVSCARCKLYLPKQDAITAAGRTYCSLEHAKA